MEVTFELHAYANDRWSIVHKYPGGEQEKALEHARQLYREPHVSNVKVVKETYDPATNQSTDMTIFDTSKAERASASTWPPPKPTQPPKAGPASGSATATRAARRPQKTISLTGIVVLTILAIAAAAVFFVLLDVLGRSLVGP